MLRQVCAAWWRRNVIGADPAPAYSQLDIADGLGSLPQKPARLRNEQVGRLWSVS